MTETTTIQVRKDQAEQLKKIASKNGNYKTAIDTLLEEYNPREVTLEATEYGKIADAIEQRLQR